jgi:hypothetical protein
LYIAIISNLIDIIEVAKDIGYGLQRGTPDISWCLTKPEQLFQLLNVGGF